MTITARLVERTRFGPPALVSFLPGFWLLVPGALGLIGVTEYIASGPVVGVQDFLGTVGAMVAIALGSFAGTSCWMRSSPCTATRCARPWTSSHSN